jgi:hypothetical protein
MKKSQGIRAAISAINTYGILVVPGLVDQRTAAGCAANADAALGESLLSCDGSSPCRYAVQLGLTHATRAAVLAVRGSAPMASALAAQLGDDAALCELSCEMSDGGAPIKPMHCATPACVEDAQTHYQEALAQRGASVLTVLIALCDVGYRAGAPLVWPRSHAAAVHADVRTRGADALRDGVGVHFDLRCGDAVLLDSRLWRCGGAHAPGLHRTALLAISFCMPSLFPDGRQYTMRPTLVAQFSLLNMEAALARFIDWEASYGSSARQLPSVHVPRPIAALLCTVLSSSSVPADDARLRRCLQLLNSAMTSTSAPALEDLSTKCAVSDPAPLASGSRRISLDPPLSRSDPAPLAPGSDAAETARMVLDTARMVLVPFALLRMVRSLVGTTVRSEARWRGLWRYVDGVLADGPPAALQAEAVPLSREELRERWQEAHASYPLSRVSELRPPADPAAFASALGAAAKGDLEGVLAWLRGGGEVNAQANNSGSTLLQKASAGGAGAVVDALLEHGAKVNMQDEEGVTALHAAAFIGHPGIVRSLVRAQATLDICDADGETALEWATGQGHTEVAALLQLEHFTPAVLGRLVDSVQVGKLLALRSHACAWPVHDDGAGHEVIFLHAAMASGLLSGPCVEVIESIVQSMKDHDPRGREAAAGLNVRCVELHHYSVGAGLMDPDHKDSGSSLTLSVLLTDPSMLRGGEFLTWQGHPSTGVAVAHALGLGDGILFRSEDYHNVRPVTAGTRETLIIELWVGQSNRVDRNR